MTILFQFDSSVHIESMRSIFHFHYGMNIYLDSLTLQGCLTSVTSIVFFSLYNKRKHSSSLDLSKTHCVYFLMSA